MAPTTRSGSRPKASSSKRTLLAHEPSQDNNESASSAEEESKPGTTLQGLLKGALKGAKHVERENATLRKKVAGLEDKLSRLQDADDAPLRPKRTQRVAASVAKLEAEVKRLNGRVRKLEQSKEKYRKRLHELSMREVKTEADELVDDAEFEVGDSAYKMRKLLREFHDLMVANSLEEGGSEDCPICMEQVKPKECRSLPCQHLLCTGCAKELRPVPGGHPDIEVVSCPVCRSECQRDELELVEYTASEQWDALLGVAERWAKMDTRREESTSEEEDEEEFIDDGKNETSTTVSEHVPANPLETSPEPNGEADPAAEPQTPSRLRRRAVLETPQNSPDREFPEGDGDPQQEAEDTAEASNPDLSSQAGPSGQTYAQTPRKDKRKMLEDLAAARSKKRRL